MLGRLISAQNKRNWHPHAFLMFCGFVGLMRGLLEVVVQGVPLHNSEMLNFVPFYVLLGMLLTQLLSSTAGVSFQSVQKSLTMGLFLGLFPPLFDFILFGNRSAYYGYYFIWNFHDLPWLGYKPEFNFPAGETLTIWISIVFCAAYTAVISRSVWRTVLAFLGAYVVFVLMGSLLPMIVTRLSGIDLHSVTEARAADPATLRALSLRIAFYQGVMALFMYLSLRGDLVRQLLPRVFHVAPFLMLTALGGFIVQANPVVLTQAILLMACVTVAVSVQNDFFDSQESREKQKFVAAQRFDVQIINFLTILALLPIFFQNNRAAVAAAIAFICGIIYNYPFYRARNYFPANLKIEGVWGLTSFLAGALLDPRGVSQPLVVLIAFMVFGGWSTVSVLKDLKDAEEDSQAHVKTLFTIFLSRGVKLTKIWRIVRGVLIVLVSIPAWITFNVLPIQFWATLVVISGVLMASFWLKNYRIALRIQLVLVCIYIGFWQYTFVSRVLNP